MIGKVVEADMQIARCQSQFFVLRTVADLAPALLQRCMQENPEFMDVTTITLWSSFKSLRLNLWDEEQRELVSVGALKQVAQQRMA